MRTLLKQENCDLKITTPLGKDALIMDRLTGVEQACATYCFKLEMHSTRPDIDFSALVAKPVQVCFDYKGEKRYYCGVVGEIEQTLTTKNNDHWQTHYVARIYPTFWLLKFTQDYRIFQDMPTIDIIHFILKNNGVTRVEDKTTTCGKKPREYCVQYGESHFNFACRLMEEEGIFYYFKHDAGGDTLVMADMDTVLTPALGAPLPVNNTESVTTDFNKIQSLYPQQQVVTKTFSCADYNFKTASVHLYNTVGGDGVSGRVYRYPGIYLTPGEGDQVAKLRIEELDWRKNTAKGRSTAPLLCPLFKMTVKDHPRADANKTYIIYRVHHDVFINATVEERYIYQNEYEAFPDNIPFRSPIITPKPIIPSTQTAKVTTKPGEEIWVDKYGRIKVKFHWDQYGPNDDGSSCWIRYAVIWSGSKWGAVWTPRIGMEVVVTFLEGNPDRPLITGCVYNSDHMPPYLPDEPTKSTIKSHSTKGGGPDNYNEFRFEDKKGSEEIYTQAEKDMNTLVKHDRYLEIRTGNDTTEIMQGRRKVTLFAKGAKKGDDYLTLIRGDRSVLIVLGNQLITLVKGNRILTLVMGNEVITVNGMRIVTTTRNEIRTVGQNLMINVGQNVSIAAGGSITIVAGKTLTLIGNPVIIA